jgi:hypothetical protein
MSSGVPIIRAYPQIRLDYPPSQLQVQAERRLPRPANLRRRFHLARRLVPSLLQELLFSVNVSITLRDSCATVV